jgi:DNA-directed RNA polymerase specialized sigma24 family protein
VRRFILDRFDQLRRRGHREELSGEAITLPDDVELTELVEVAQMRRWISDRIAELEQGRVDPRVAIPLAQPRQVGEALRRHIGGANQRDIAAALGISLGAVNKRIAQGTSYLIVLQGIEQGLGGV